MIEPRTPIRLNKVDLAIGKFAELPRRAAVRIPERQSSTKRREDAIQFTGTLEKVQIKLGPNEPAPQQRGELEQLKRDFALAVQ